MSTHEEILLDQNAIAREFGTLWFCCHDFPNLSITVRHSYLLSRSAVRMFCVY